MTSRDVFVSTSSATGLMEAAVRNGSRGRVLALVNGGFSERFARITAACGIEMDVLEVSWGATHEPEVVHDALVAGVYDAVSVVHSETSTGALQDLPALSEVVAEFDDTLLLVDSVTGVGGAELRADEWGLDFVLTGSQKALALPPGLSFAVASEAMMDRSATAERKGVYFDLETFAKNMAELQTPTTPALSLPLRPPGAAREDPGRDHRGTLAPAPRDGAHVLAMGRASEVGIGGHRRGAGERGWSLTYRDLCAPSLRRERPLGGRSRTSSWLGDRWRLREAQGSGDPDRPHGRPHAVRAEGAPGGAWGGAYGVSERYRVLVADNVSESGLAPLLEDGRFEVERGGSGLEAFGDSLRTADALIVRSATKVDRDLLTRAPRLRVVGRAGVGVDNIDLPEATERGIAVLNAPAGNTVSAAELTMALMLALVRRIPSADRSVRASEWKRSRFAGLELRGKSLGLVGAGRIGGEVARRARAFGMEIMGYDPYLTEERADELGVDRVEFEELLSRADVISLHVPLTDRTRMMIGGTELTAVKPGAFLVNVARGGVVDEAALAAALVDGRLAGAALDVYAQEPLEADSPLRTAPNIILTPHLGASTAEAQELVATEIAAAVAAALLHGDLSRALNAPAIGGDELRRMRPLLGLGQRLGRLAAALSEGATKGVEVRYTGESRDGLRALSSYVLMGLLGSMLGQDQVNFVNAPHLAEGRGVGVLSSSARATERLHRVRGGRRQLRGGTPDPCGRRATGRSAPPLGTYRRLPHRHRAEGEPTGPA